MYQPLKTPSAAQSASLPQTIAVELLSRVSTESELLQDKILVEGDSARNVLQQESVNQVHFAS